MSPLRIDMLVALVRPIGSGELKLTSLDPNVKPFLNHNYLMNSFDRERLREGVRLCVDLAEYKELKTIFGRRIRPLDNELASNVSLDDWLLRVVTTFAHIACTCRMGPESDSMAVVDQFGKVHGFEQLRIVDASIMPNLVRASLNPTVMMMGERVAHLIDQGW